MAIVAYYQFYKSNINPKSNNLEQLEMAREGLDPI